MKVRLTLVADGPFDSALLPILVHTLHRDASVSEIDYTFAHPQKLPPASDGLARRVDAALALYPANLLVVHRDAERESLGVRRKEIDRELKRLSSVLPPWAAAIPVRMTEAWLLFDIAAIRRAAGNPRGTMPLRLPRIQDLETIPDPKRVLHEALTTASGRSGRALSKFNVREAATRVAELIDDFSPLGVLPAYQQLQGEIASALLTLSRRRPPDAS